MSSGVLATAQRELASEMCDPGTPSRLSAILQQRSRNALQPRVCPRCGQHHRKPLIDLGIEGLFCEGCVDER